MPHAVMKMSKASIKRALYLLTILSVIFSSRAMTALDPHKRISQYGHTSWKIQDGYFGGQPVAMAQTADGYLWVGTEGEIFRFDGVQFVSLTSLAGEKLPPINNFNMFGARDGSLYIGTDSGLLRWANQLLTRYLDGETVGGIMQDEKGQIWFTHYRPGNYSDPLCRISGTDVRCYDYGTVERGLLSAPGHLAEDASGSFWVGLYTAVVRWKAGSAKIYQLTRQGGTE